MSNATETHKFEAAGLGVAPFRYAGSERKTYQAIPGDPSCPIQPGGSCDFCHTAISLFCWIESADGRRFKVGSECVRKTGDAGIIRQVNRDKAAAQKTRDAARIAAALETLDARPDVVDRFRALPHPSCKGLTLLDWANWQATMAGHAGKLQLARRIEKEAKA
jgi:hypothetical protein